MSTKPTPAPYLPEGFLDVGLLLATLHAYRKGDFSVRLPLDWTGAAGKVADTLNSIIETSNRMARELARLGRVVGTEGKLGGQAVVEGVSGTWKDPIDNINEMIGNLRDTTQKNTEQDWLKTNLARFSRLLQGQRDLLTVCRLILSELAPLVSAAHGVFYLIDTSQEPARLKLLATYAYKERKNLATEFRLGDGLVGQCALEKQRILLTNVPGDYVQIGSGLGQATPLNIIVLPILFEGQVRAVVELASFERFSAIHQALLDQLTESIGIVLNTLEANLRTQELLTQSQSMAQELRTPLNSLLILAERLAENADGNLTAQQIEFARTIHSSGSDLLSLITDILDLSKIESGTVTLDVAAVEFPAVREYVERTFRHVAQGKGLEFIIELDPHLPRSLATDAKRLQQVLKKLLSNAFKFTERGRVNLRICPAGSGWSRDAEALGRARQVIAFAVSDTGTGIPADKQQIIFEAFQQAEGTTSRKYGGTGLGLPISREIANLLGGEIHLLSAPGEGSTFTLYLPHAYSRAGTPDGPRLDEGRETFRRSPRPPVPRPVADISGGATATAAVAVGVAAPAEVEDDRDDIRPDDRVLLIIEDDPALARILLDRVHERGFKAFIAPLGETALELAREQRPDAITLDLRLPDMDGWLLLDRLKHDPATRHIPVHIISDEEGAERGLKAGAIACLGKPATKEALDQALASLETWVERREKRLLVVHPEGPKRQALLELAGGGEVRSMAVGAGQEALAALEAEPFDCMVLDLDLPDMTGFQLLEQIQQRPALRGLPVIVYSDKPLDPEQEAHLSRIARRGVVKEARSPEQLIEDTTLFLHQVEASLPEAKRRMLDRLHQTDPGLAGRKILIVDDDVRNIFALTSRLERHGIEVYSAESSQEALKALEETPGMDLVLMDVMMPEMDGYEATRAIHAIPQHRALPIIAVTAKAMKGDRAKCLEAGASDYLAKPVDTQRLLSLLRVWLYRS